MSFGGSRVRPAGSRKSILELGGEGGGGETGLLSFLRYWARRQPPA